MLLKRKNSSKWYAKFKINGKQVMKCCDTNNEALAKRRETDFIAELKLAAKEAANKPVVAAEAPTLREFIRLPTDTDPGGVWWSGFATNRYADRPATLDYYQQRVIALLKCAPLADLRLNEVLKTPLFDYANYLCGRGWKTSTQKKSMVFLHLVLKVAWQKDLISSLPLFMTFPKPKRIGRVLSAAQEQVYMAAVDQNMRDFALLLVETAMEPGAAAELLWSDVYFGEVDGFTNGYVYDRCQKTETRERPLGMTPELAQAMRVRKLASGGKSLFVFPSDRLGLTHPTPLTTFQSVQKRLWTTGTPLPIPRFRLYDFRHTALTRMVEAGATAFDLKQAAGWNSIRMADEYIKLGTASRGKAAVKFGAYTSGERKKAQSLASA